MADKFTVKQGGKLVLLGSGVVILTPLVNGFVSGVQLLQTAIPFVNVTVGTAISAGVAAFAMQWVIEQYL